MEKQGMGKRRRLVRAGLLIILFWIFFPGNLLFSQALELRVETFPYSPVANSSWSVFILVNHPHPQEVSITPPAIPPSLALELIRTESRFIQGEVWTSVEYSFTALAAGALTLAPFAVAVPGLQAETGVTSVSFQPSAAVPHYNPVFRWLAPVTPVPAGQRGELTLELSGWDSRRGVPEGIFRGRAPRNAILNEAPPSPAGAGRYLYVVSIIPLEEGSIVLEPFSFQAAGFALAVPELAVQALPPVQEPLVMPINEASRNNVPQGEALGDEGPHFPFPETREAVFFLLRDEYDRVVAEVRALWEEGRRAQALAAIRRNERDSLSGPFLAPLRREMEQSLGLRFTNDERWRPLRVPLFLWVFFGCFVWQEGRFCL